MRKKAFTIVEILVVMVAMGALSAAVIPKIWTTKERTKETMTKVSQTRKIASELGFNVFDNWGRANNSNSTQDESNWYWYWYWYNSQSCTIEIDWNTEWIGYWDGRYVYSDNVNDPCFEQYVSCDNVWDDLWSWYSSCPLCTIEIDWSTKYLAENDNRYVYPENSCDAQYISCDNWWDNLWSWYSSCNIEPCTIRVDWSTEEVEYWDGRYVYSDESSYSCDAQYISCDNWWDNLWSWYSSCSENWHGYWYWYWWTENNKINGVCSATHYRCTAWTSLMNKETSTQYTWKCVWANGWTTANCTEENKKINGVCSATHYGCTAWTSSDNNETSRKYIWKCVWTNGWITANCTENKNWYSWTEEFHHIWTDITICDPNNSTKCITIMDRNLWATKAGTTCSITDAWACGYHFQWWNNHGFAPCLSGNICYNFPWWETSKGNSIDTSRYWPQDYFNDNIFRSTYPKDWSNPRNDNLRWWVTNTHEAMQWPCPSWYHVPSRLERTNLVQYRIADYNKKAWWNTRDFNSNWTPSGNNEAFWQFVNYFKLPHAGSRFYGEVNHIGQVGYYWSSTAADADRANLFEINLQRSQVTYGIVTWRAAAFSIRCFKNK